MDVFVGRSSDTFFNVTVVANALHCVQPTKTACINNFAKQFSTYYAFVQFL